MTTSPQVSTQPTNTAGPVPLMDLRAAHDEVAQEVAAGFAGVLAATAFIDGPDVAAFEREFAQFSAIDHCVGVANGTDALELALRAVGVGAGHEVILPANTFVATAEAVSRCGATPVLVDCDPEHYLIDVGQVADRLSARTRAVVPVHLYGQMAPVERLIEVLAGTGVAVVEDAAQCQGATRHGWSAGALTSAASTSFYPGKNLGAYGDAGAVVTRDEGIAQRVRMMRNHGGTVKYRHDIVGMNSRLDTLQAVVLRAKLRRLAAWNAARRDAASRYDALLADLAPDIERPGTLAGNEHVWHLYVVRVPRRDNVAAYLRDNGVGTSIHYPAPVHRLPAYADLAACSAPVAERTAEQILSLPVFPTITGAQQERVVEVLAAALRR